MEELKLGTTAHVKIASGSFTEAGNFTAKNKKGIRYHIPKRMLDALDIKENSDISFPLHAYSVVSEIGVRNPNAVQDDKGQWTDVITGDACNEFLEERVLRAEITAIYKSRQEYIDDEIDDSMESVEIAKGIEDRAKKVGLNEEAVIAIVNASIPS